MESLVLPVAGIAVVLSLLYLSLWKSGQDDLLPDFLPLCAAGQLIRTDPGSLHNRGSQLETQQAAAGIRPQSFLSFAYPPVTAGLFAPLTLLSYRSAYAVWVLISLLMLGLSIYLCSDNFQLGEEDVPFGLLPLLTVMLVWPWTGHKVPVMALVSLILFGFALRQAWRRCHER